MTGHVHKPTLPLYWSTETIFSTPIFASVMTRNRYQLLLRVFHLNDNDKEPDRDDPERDRLYKVRPFIDELLKRFMEVYKPTSNVAIDESLLLWKGALIFRQYIPLKSARFGIKIFQLCEDSDYTYRFHIYSVKYTLLFIFPTHPPSQEKHPFFMFLK